MTKIKEGVAKVGVYRIAIDGAMILSLLIMAWKMAEAYTILDTTASSNRENIASNYSRISAMEKRLPEIPITQEADRRLTALETTVAIQYPEIARRLGAIEDRLNKP